MTIIWQFSVLNKQIEYSQCSNRIVNSIAVVDTFRSISFIYSIAKSTVMAFCTQFKINEHIFALVFGNSANVSKHPVSSDWCNKPWTLLNWLCIMAAMILLTVISTTFTRAARKAAGLVWEKTSPYIEGIVPTRYFWSKITGRPSIRTSEHDFSTHHEFQPIRRESRIIRTMRSEQHGPHEYSKIHGSVRFRPIAK